MVTPVFARPSRELLLQRSDSDDLRVVHTPATRVLVALEQPLFSDVLRVALRDSGGYDVVGTCAVLEDLPALAARLQPDVILLDLDSAHSDGVAVLRRVRSAIPHAAVLVLCAAPGPELLSEAMAAGAAGYVSLSSDVLEVIAAVRTAASGQVVLSGERLESLVRHLAQRAAPQQPSGPGGRLTEREVEVLRLLVRGTSTPVISSTLYISMHTARTHVQNVLVKLGAHSRLEAAAYAVRHGLVTME